MHVESENEREKQTDREIREATGGLYVCFYNDCLSDCVRMKGEVKRKRRVKNPHTPFFLCFFQAESLSRSGKI